MWPVALLQLSAAARQLKGLYERSLAKRVKVESMMAVWLLAWLLQEMS